MRSLSGTVSLILLALIVSCGGGGQEDSPNQAAVTSEAWDRFEASAGCLTVKYPRNWHIVTQRDLGTNGAGSCPGSSAAQSRVVDCGRSAVEDGVGTLRVSPFSDFPGVAATRVELVLSISRCSTLDGHFEQLQARLMELGATLNEGQASTIGGFESRCAEGTWTIKEPVTAAGRICALAVDGAIYHLWAVWDAARADEFKDTILAIVDTLQINPDANLMP